MSLAKAVDRLVQVAGVVTDGMIIPHDEWCDFLKAASDYKDEEYGEYREEEVLVGDE